MSEANPTGAAQALAGRAYKFRCRECCLTEGALLGLDILGVDAGKVSDVRVLGAVLFLSGLTPVELSALLSQGKEAIEFAVAKFLKKNFRRRKALAEAVNVVGSMVLDYVNSFCKYEFPSFGKSAHKDLRISGVGNRAAVAMVAMSKFRMSWLEYLATPATRMNVFYAALCESNGGVGLDTFYGREQLAEAETVFKREREKEEQNKTE